MLSICTENQYKIKHFELEPPILYNKRDLSPKNWRNCDGDGRRGIDRCESSGYPDQRSGSVAENAVMQRNDRVDRWTETVTGHIQEMINFILSYFLFFWNVFVHSSRQFVGGHWNNAFNPNNRNPEEDKTSSWVK